MIIGIDYRFAVTTVRGIGMHIREIVAELMQIDRVNTYILYCQDDPAMTLPPNFRVQLLPRANIFLYEQWYLPVQAKKDAVDVLWYPSNSGPLLLDRRIKLFVTVHDVISFKGTKSGKPFSFKEFKHRLGEKYRAFALKQGLRRINGLLTVSHYSAGEIVKLLGRKPEVIYNHIRRENLPEDPQVLERMGLTPGNYIYSMTGESPHKNLAGTLEIAAAVALKFKLVVSGVYDAGLIGQLAETTGEDVIFTGRVSEAEKNTLYRNACAFLFLPFYEGFGIPLLEAMHYELPVIASDRTSLPEVAGEGAELVDPRDVVYIRSLLNTLPWDKSGFLKAQQEQLKKFSDWRSAAAQLLMLMENARNLPGEVLE